MRRAVVIFLTALAAVVHVCGAFSEGQMELARTELRQQHMIIISKNLQLTPEQQEAFWPVYREYARDIATASDSKFEIIREFYTNYDLMKPEVAASLIQRTWDYQEKIIQIKRHYHADFNRVLGEVLATRFYQLDHRLDLITDLQILQEMPLVQEYRKLDAEAKESITAV